MKLPSVEPLGSGERRRLVEIAGLLARPRLGEREADAARRAMASVDWVPLRAIPALSGLEALMVHHAVELGFSAGHLFDPAPSVDFARLGLNHMLRTRERDRVLDAFREQGVARAMLVKGAAIAPFWPSPALREMEDIDVVVACEHVGSASRALEGLGWKRHEFGWRHPASGCLLDLSVPKAEFARAVFGRAEAHPLLRRDGVSMPRAADHLVIVANHAARNRGLRIWRDLCDATTILDAAGSPEAAAEAREVAARHGKSAEVCAFLRTLSSAMEFELPADGSGEDGRSRELRLLYAEMLADPVSVFGMNALAGLSLSPVAFLRAGWRSVRRSGRETTAAPGQLDPAFGALPGAGNLSRQGIKLRWMWHLLRAGRLGHYVKLLRRSDAAFAAGKVFDDA